MRNQGGAAASAGATHWLSFFAQAYEMLVINEFHDTPEPFYFTSPADVLPPLRVSGDGVLAQFGYQAERFNADLAALATIGTVCLVATLACLLLSHPDCHSAAFNLVAGPDAGDWRRRHFCSAMRLVLGEHAAALYQAQGADAQTSVHSARSNSSAASLHSALVAQSSGSVDRDAAALETSPLLGSAADVAAPAQQCERQAKRHRRMWSRSHRKSEHAASADGTYDTDPAAMVDSTEVQLPASSSMVEMTESQASSVVASVAASESCTGTPCSSLHKRSGSAHVAHTRAESADAVGSGLRYSSTAVHRRVSSAASEPILPVPEAGSGNAAVAPFHTRQGHAVDSADCASEANGMQHAAAQPAAEARTAALPLSRVPEIELGRTAAGERHDRVEIAWHGLSVSVRLHTGAHLAVPLDGKLTDASSLTLWHVVAAHLSPMQSANAGCISASTAAGAQAICAPTAQRTPVSAGAEKRVLADVSGSAGGLSTSQPDPASRQAASAMLAILGPSGAGKSTLLDVLAGRPGRRRVRGRVALQGRAAPPAELRRVCGYVLQDDVFPGGPTWVLLRMLAIVGIWRSQ